MLLDGEKLKTVGKLALYSGDHGMELRSTSLVFLPQKYCNESYSYVGFESLLSDFTEDLMCAVDPSKNFKLSKIHYHVF